MQQPEEDEENSTELEAAYQQLEAEQAELGADDCECTGRVVTELVEAGNVALPDRFMFAMRAIRGDFSPPQGAEDTDRAEDALTAALLNFPATVTMRVVTRPLEGREEADSLVAELNMMLATLEGADAPEVDVKERPGGRQAINFSLRVPDASSYRCCAKRSRKMIASKWSSKYRLVCLISACALTFGNAQRAPQRS